jgi:predicted nucleic acid-binding protein
MIHLDTNFLIHFLAGRELELKVVEDAELSGELFAVSSVVWTEFLSGPVSANHISRAKALIRNDVVSFGFKEAELAAKVFNDAGRKRYLRADTMIAATAILYSARLASSDPKGFCDVRIGGT